MKVILASASPRRRELLRTIVPDLVIAPSRDLDEVYPDTLPADEVPVYLSRLKAEGYNDLVDADTVLITADTVVIIDDQILGKPHDREEAIDMLKRLSGRVHHVVTGVTILAGDSQPDSFGVCTEVMFAPLSQDVIEYYVDNYHPYDKAGAYGIQEWIGAAAIEKINGSYYNVVGLPLHAVFKRLRAINSFR